MCLKGNLQEERRMSEKTETYFLNKCLKFSNKTDICIKSMDLSSFLPLFRPNFLEIFSFFKWQERRLFLKQFFILSMKLWFSSYKMVLIKSALKQVFFSYRFADINRKIKISKVSTKWCLHFKRG